MGMINYPDGVWALRFRGLGENPEEEEAITVTYRSKKHALDALYKYAVPMLEEKYPEEMWFADLEDARGKTKFAMWAVSTDKVYVVLEKVPFYGWNCPEPFGKLKTL